MTKQLGDTETREWLPHIERMLNELSKDDSLLHPGIYTVPTKFKSSSFNDDALCPRIVSIGHFHNGVPGLLAMHEQKLFYLSFLLHRTKDAKTTLEECCAAIWDSEHFRMYARNFGSDAVPPEKMMEIMVIDGCFLLELLLRFSNPDMIDEGDVVLNKSWFAPSLRHDLLLLQNQIPMFVLQILVKKISRVSRKVPCRDSDHFIGLTMDVLGDLAYKFFGTCVDKIIHSPSGSKRFFSGDRLHFLNMMHDACDLLVLQPDDSNEGDVEGQEKTPKLSRCTEQLLAAGVTIEKAENKHLLDLSFEDKTLKIPPLCVDLNTWSVLKNLVVLEQCSVDRRHHVTSYATVLKNLIQTKRDVELLKQKGILEVDLAEENDGVLAFVNCVVSGTVIRGFTYQTMFAELNAHRDPWWRWRKLKALCKLSWHKNKRILKRDYFPNPWRVIQIVVAFLLVALTILQTFYSPS